MRSKNLRRVALALPVIAVAFCPSCDLYSCDKGETETDTACEQVQNAANGRAATCKLGNDVVGVLCTLDCIKSSKDGKYCRGNDEIEACLAAIESIACRDYTRSSIEAASSCSSLLNRLATDCVDGNASSSHHDDDWD